ncbi:ABC transporter ATP-binding protein/permease [Paracoccus sp. SCSIO 75233]|uniref:ABC transporter ATP-binding protein/permease n=1 Tax=Paracoccus sp. SCSIO 75233 TaxID=3017782 RepID=UPI0022EFE2E1|nr:ATP-binding cassette domain-containing protein [Paracoccus sp. SCSIO 75233]WBU54504.1 ATP-binding cassette domain-containing protein [Paracoccus sp. SCSIO 75233]
MRRNPTNSKGAARLVEGAARREAAVAHWLLILSGAIWPVQAALVAWCIGGWVTGDLSPTPYAASGFVVLSVLRALIERHAAAVLFRIGDEVLARERAALMTREMRARGPEASASVAALVTDKLPLLVPWITRYEPAMARVRVLPLLYLLLAVVIAWPAALILAISGPLIPVFMILIGIAAEAASRRQLAEIGNLNALLMERLSALIDLRLLGATDRAANEFETRANGLKARTMAVLRIAFLSSTVLELFAAIGVAMMAVYVGFSLLGVIGFGSWGNGLSVSEGVFLLLLAPDFFLPLREMAAAWHDRAAGLAVLSELDDADEATRQPILGQGAPASPLDGPLDLHLRDAVVALDGRELPLPDLDLSQGEAVAVTGPSGSGKTTLLAVAAGMLPLQAGEVEVAGTPLTDERADGWRARLAVMQQTVFFPDMTLSDWLGEGAEDAVRLAQAEGVIAGLPSGLQTRLGENGAGVSGGEARRLSLARAIASDRELLIADEPTADLDEETAARIIAAMHGLKARGKTLLVATHDPALIAAMDREVRLG